ncbi:hypothetical protein MP228_001279 [Amoeboaphelidium protococcarum]|nr:hypothetical protein MP228_001279 [Amoeboaphelidium protococcarum]
MSLKKRARPATSEEESSVQSSHNFSDDNNDNDTDVQMGSSAHGKGATDDIRQKYADYKVHLSLKSQPNVPAFLIKLYNMVNDKGCDDMIQWSPDGMSFIVLNQEDFSQYVLPKFFKHNNFSSFVRQLNMYGFHKVVDVLQGVKQDQSSTERQEFKQDFFQRDNPQLMEQMKRKAAVKSAQAKLDNAIQLLAGSGGNSIVGTSGGGGTGNNMLSTLNASDVGIIIQEINAIKQTQLAITQEMQNISQQNEIIWKEMMQQQQRHQQQELVVNNIVRFLAQLAKLDKSGTLKGRVEQQFSQLLQHATQSSSGGVKSPYLIGDSQSLDDNDVYSNDGDNFALNESTNALMQSLSSQQQQQQPSIQQIPSPSDTSSSSARGQKGQQLAMSPMNPSAYQSQQQQQQYQQPPLQINPSKLLTQVPYNQSHINDISSDLEILNDNINDVTGALGYDLDQFSSIEDFLNEIQSDNKQQQQQ